jgi:hypothetical protein
MHGRNHRPKGWYGPDDPGGSDPLNWMNNPPGRRRDEVILSHSPVGFWKLNEASGTTAADSSGNGNHLNAGGWNAPDWVQPSGPPGDVTADFSDDARVSRSWPVISSDFTAELWVYRLTTDYQPLMGQGTPIRFGERGWQLWVTGDSQSPPNRPAFTLKGAAVQAPDPLAVNTWAHIAGVLEGTTARLYVDGEKVDEETGVTWTPVAPPAADVWIGHDGATGVLPMEARGSYAALYNRALTDTEILSHVTSAPPEGRIVSVPYTIQLTDRFIFATGTGTVTLPSADARNGIWFTVKNIDTGTVTVSAPGTEKMEGAGSPGTASLSAGVSRQFTSDGIGWRITGGYL